MILLRLELTKDGKPTDRKRAEEENDRLYEPKNDKILQLSAKILVPVIILFGIYVILNGHLSPGGGFSAEREALPVPDLLGLGVVEKEPFSTDEGLAVQGDIQGFVDAVHRRAIQ